MIPFSWEAARPILLIYQILTAGGTWDFYAVDTVPDNGICRQWKADLTRFNTPLKVGNVRILCTADRRVYL